MDFFMVLNEMHFSFLEWKDFLQDKMACHNVSIIKEVQLYMYMCACEESSVST